MSRGCSRPES
eukprot:gene19836-biopygen6340